MNIEDIREGSTLVGLEPGAVCNVVFARKIGETSVQVIYKLPDGQMKERLIGPQDLDNLKPAEKECPWSFTGNPEDFQLAVEAKRIDLAFLFDPMMAVHASNIDPFPHQITAVYESMLPRQPLRYVLADDPGAGKTIMAGLYIRELLMRADAKRILIVAPGSLVEQWRDELFQKFGLRFHVFSRELVTSSPTGNPFEDYDQLIVRLDQMSRNEDEQVRICANTWDLVVFDEAHKLSAHFYGNEIKRTRRFNFAEKLGQHTRHLLLMTATPHNGKEEDFQLFLSLLDSDRFYGKFRDGVHKVDCTDIMRRMVKEEMYRFDGRPLFPERKAYTVNYLLSDLEIKLYEAVTSYVKTEMGKADTLDGTRRGSVGFALTSLQRRLASSPEAVFQSLKRRRERLENRLRDEKLGIRAASINNNLPEIPEDDDDLNAEEQEQLEEILVDQATAARSIEELAAEIEILKNLEKQASEVITSGLDRKWDELSKILQHSPEMLDQEGRRRKLIIFSEHRDTLNYLYKRIAGVVGSEAPIVTIHGGTGRDERIRIQEQFRCDPEIRILIATDAAGEGVNLQNANLMVNYDLPWNPNRLEQRFGRIHRIGQLEVCHLWNLVASETREGEVYHRLLKKLEVESEALKGRVFDILGEVFEDVSLKDLLIEAIRYGDQPERRKFLETRIENVMNHEHLCKILERNALAQETMSAQRLFAVKEEMEKAEARRLQPFFVRSFFLNAFKKLGGVIYERESGRYEITHVPALLRERDRLITGRNRSEQMPVLKRYERVCFTKESIKPQDKPGMSTASLLHPGHPLMLALTDVILEKFSNLLKQGTILIDNDVSHDQPYLLMMLSHEIRSGNDQVISKRMQFISVNQQGNSEFSGWAPHLDMMPLDDSDRIFAQKLLDSDWLKHDLESAALEMAANTLVPQHYEEVAGRRIAHVEKTLAAVDDRLKKEINFWTDRWLKLKEDAETGKDLRLNIENARRIVTDLETRLETRKKELSSMRHIVTGTPVIMGAALVIPHALLEKLKENPDSDISQPGLFCADAQARKIIEKIAMQAVSDFEHALGNRTVDVSMEKCGWDITSYPPDIDGKQIDARHIEVKGRHAAAQTITVTRNEIITALNQGEKFILAIVLINDDNSFKGPYYVKNPFKNEPDWGVTSINMNIGELLKGTESNERK